MVVFANFAFSVFGVPVMIDDAVYEDEIINEILGLSENEKFKIPEEDMIEFLKIVSKQQVEMEPEADEMLRDYFTATRMIRESENNSTLINYELNFL